MTLVPDRAEVAARAAAHRGGRGWQAGGGPGGAEGAVRRAQQHHLGPAAGIARHPRGLRVRQPQDAHQAVPGRTSEARTASSSSSTPAPATTTRPPRRMYTDIGMITSDPNIVARRGRRLQPADRLLEPDRVPRADRGARAPPEAPGRADRPRGRAREGGPSRAPHHQGERPHRRPDDPRAVSRLAGGPRHRAARAGRLFACVRVFPASATASTCGRSSDVSWSIRGSTGSRTAATRRCTSAAPI